jgi:hypothetical protein
MLWPALGVALMLALRLVAQWPRAARGLPVPAGR